MKILLNTLYITNPHYYLSLSGENILVKQEKETIHRFPLHNLQQIICFSFLGVSPKLMEACTSKGIGLSFLSQHGRLQARVVGISQGNVSLRKRQVLMTVDSNESLEISRNMILAKISNSRSYVNRMLRQYPMRLHEDNLLHVSEHLKRSIEEASTAETIDTLRGIEGDAQASFFGVFNEFILNQKEFFHFDGRSRRPPLDPVNALLSFAYSLLTHEVAAALEANGLDAYIGFMHVDRPGRLSLALDMIEELRTPIADRFVLSLINRKQVNEKDFIVQENDAVLLTDDGRKRFLSAWQNAKQEEMTHPFLKEKISWGLVPHVQSLLLSRYLRGDLDGYPPLFW